MKQQLSYQGSKYDQFITGKASIIIPDQQNASLHTPRKNSNESTLLHNHLLQKKLLASNKSPSDVKIEFILNSSTKPTTKVVTSNSQIHKLALGELGKKWNASTIEDVVYRAKMRLAAKSGDKSDSDYDLDSARLELATDKIAVVKRIDLRNDEKLTLQKSNTTNVFKKQLSKSRVSSDNAKELYYTPQDKPMLSARFKEVDSVSSDCIFKSEQGSPQKKQQSAQSVKYESIEPNKNQDLQKGGQIQNQKRRPLQGFLAQQTVIQQEKQKLRNSQQFNVQSHLTEFKLAVQKKCIEQMQIRAVEAHYEAAHLTKSSAVLLSPRAQIATKKAQSRQTQQHTRKQSFATKQLKTVETPCINNQNIIEQKLDLISAINRTTLQESISVPISNIDVKRRSKSRTNKLSINDKIQKADQQYSMMRSSVLFKTSESKEQFLRNEEPSIIFKNSVNQPKLNRQQREKQQPQVIYDNKKVKKIAVSQRDASKQRIHTLQPEQVTKSTVEILKTSKENCWGMLDSEILVFGDRSPKSYQKIGLLGKGGIAIVWLCLNENGQRVAVKQFPKKPGQTKGLDNSAKTEVSIYNILFGQSKPHQGLNHIAKLLGVIEESKDSWLVYEVGKSSLNSQLFEVKGEFYRGERIYNIIHKEFFRALAQDKSVMKDFIRLMAEVLDSLQEKKIVHADLKPDNILIEFEGRRIKSLKLIDFGSAFQLDGATNITATTPEYLSPEILQYLEIRGSGLTSQSSSSNINLFKGLKPWSYDMWSLGAILLELLSGIPIWMSLKCRTVPQFNGKQTISTGVFGVQGRQGQKILIKQQNLLRHLPKQLQRFECYGLAEDPLFMDLLLKILHLDPLQRISPREVINHPFLQ